MVYALTPRDFGGRHISFFTEPSITQKMKKLQTMKPIIPALLLFLSSIPLLGHDLSEGEDGHSHSENKTSQSAPDEVPPLDNTPPQASPFDSFAPAVKTRWDKKFLFIESNGLPAHNMMVGITNWQQQVPIAQEYTGANAWRLPLNPQPAEEPKSIQGAFLRGAIAIAANGIPIFNPQNNRGEIAQDIGELDQWGGHCGRADDYHYHAAPLHLQETVGPSAPIAYALDGYPIYGLTEADGSEPKKLDAFNGHSTPELGYHYHASKNYPFVNGGFHGEVTERDGQVDPQPRAQPFREALPPLRGAKITGFEKGEDSSFKLTYTVNDEASTITYRLLPNGSYEFEYDVAGEAKKTAVYPPRKAGGGPGGPPSGGQPPRNPKESPAPRNDTELPSAEQPAKEPIAKDLSAPARRRSSDGFFFLTSPIVEDKGELPQEYTGDGAGLSPPLAWKSAPQGTVGFALLMDHVDRDGLWKWSWTVYEIPATASSLEKNSQDIGKLGTSFRGMIGYEPPHSKGPGKKTYVITLYALSASLTLGEPKSVSRDSLLAAMEGKVLASSSLNVTHTSEGVEPNEVPNRPPQKESQEK